MTRTRRPMTGAERQRAHRARKAGLPPPEPRDAANDPEPPDPPPPGPDFKPTLEWLAACFVEAIQHAGGQRWFNKMAKMSPPSVLKHLTAVLVANQRDALPPGIEIVVRPLLVGDAQPQPGVMHSPVAISIAPQRPLLAPAEVIDG